MFKKLVKLDPNNGWQSTEIDPIALKRSTLALRDFALNKIDPTIDLYDIRGTVLSLCDAVLNGTMKLPMNFDDQALNYKRNMDRQELMPEGLFSPWAYFSYYVLGSNFTLEKRIEKDRERYAYMDFEEPGDWPTVVKQREKERSEELGRQVKEDERLAEQKRRKS